MANGIRTGDPHGFNKGRSSKFREGFWVRQTPKEGQMTYRPKRCGNNNKDEDNSLKTLNNKNVSYFSLTFTKKKQAVYWWIISLENLYTIFSFFLYKGVDTKWLWRSINRSSNSVPFYILTKTHIPVKHWYASKSRGNTLMAVYVLMNGHTQI